MKDTKKSRICIVPSVHGVGGMVSFRHKFARGLHARGIDVCEDLEDWPYDAVLVISGTSQLAKLWRARRQGIPIIQRLDGMNWLHRVQRTGIRHFVRAESGNWLLQFIRSRLASGIVYQSEFTRQWWERVYGPTAAPSRIVYNAVDLDTYTPQGPHTRSSDSFRVQIVEGSLLGGNDHMLAPAIKLVEELNNRLDRQVNLCVAAQTSDSLISEWARGTDIDIEFLGVVSHDQIPQIDRSAHILFPAEPNPPCPNSVIEAMACGLPVVGYSTGSLPELVSGDAGLLVPYGGDPWKLDPPDVPALVEAAEQVLTQQDRFRAGARARAEAAFDLDEMDVGYLTALLN